MDIGVCAPSFEEVKKGRCGTEYVPLWRVLRAVTFSQRGSAEVNSAQHCGHAIYEVPQWLGAQKAQEDARCRMVGRNGNCSLSARLCLPRCPVWDFMSCGSDQTDRQTDRHRHPYNCLIPGAWPRIKSDQPRPARAGDQPGLTVTITSRGIPARGTVYREVVPRWEG